MSRFFEIYSGGEQRHFREDDLPLIIGTDEKAHIRLSAGRSVEASIGAHNGGYLFLEPEGVSGSVFHNDQLVKESVWIKSGDITRIGDWILQYRISGDLVEITLGEYSGPAVLDSRQKSASSPGTHNRRGANGLGLPRVDEGQRKERGHLKRNLAAGLIFFLLLFAAVYVLTARSVEVLVNPKPDSMSLQGRLLMLPLGQRFLAIEGSYRLEASRAGYRDLQTEIVVSKGGQASFTFDMEELPGLVNVSSEPGGAQVLVDGEVLGITPLRDLELSGGSHELRCVLARHQEWRQQVEIRGQGSRQSVECELQPSWGRVFVVTDPAGAIVVGQDRELGITPLTIELEDGEHTLQLRKEGFTPFALQVNVEAGNILTPPVVALEKAPVEVAVRSTPAGAQVRVDGEVQGETPVTIMLGRDQSHTISFTLVGYEPLEKTIRAGEKESMELTVSLEPAEGELTTSVSPEEAQLFIDGRKQKKSNNTFRLPVARYQVEVRAKGYHAEKRTITIAKGEKRKLDFKLEQKTAVESSPATAKSQALPPLSTVMPQPQPGKGPKMIRVEPAVFTMGASRREPGRRANENEHQVEISRPFLLGISEVTNGEYRQFRPGHRSGYIDGQTLDGDSQPVVNISWEDAARYCNWLSEQQGLQPFYREQGNTLVVAASSANGFRLPFEAEWEYAARMAGHVQPSRYPWGEGFPPRKRKGNYADESARSIVTVIIKGYYDGFPVTAPVEYFPRNKGGFFDMGGNVSEWCHDYYSPNPFPVSGRAIDPTGPKSGRHHVFRGSSWRDGAVTELRLSYRGYSNKSKDSLGFRVARYAQ